MFGVNQSFLVLTVVMLPGVLCPPPAPPTGGGGLVDVDVHDIDYGGKHVGVHVPFFYKMDLDKDPMRTGLGINVLDGLVKVRVKKDPFKKDNVFVAVAGIPFYYSK